MEKNWFDQKDHVVLIGILAVLSYFILMFGNGLVSLTHPDEVFYIQSAKEMLAKNLLLLLSRTMVCLRLTLLHGNQTKKNLRRAKSCCIL